MIDTKTQKYTTERENHCGQGLWHTFCRLRRLIDTMAWLYLSALMMVFTALYHSKRGEQNVVRPLLALDVPLMQNLHIRKVVRWAWHMASYFMAIFAAVILWPGSPNGLIIAVGTAWIVIGVAICVAWRGTHRGSYMLISAGIFAIAGVLS